ncbi:MAG: glycosyltransferase family 4 protein [Actinobacteria bacterium]|nr:glycosyltransferase family 4 protein [Actinomycetota bacterium]
MKIAFISDAIYPYNEGGKEKRIFEVTTRLGKRGYDIHLYCMKWWEGPRDRKENGINLHAICRKYPLYSGKRRSIIQGLMFGLACLKLIKEDFDIAEVDSIPFFPLFFLKPVCALKGKKIIATWHEVWGKDYWQEYLGWRGIFGYLVEKLSVFIPDEIISVSNYTTKKLKNNLKSKKKIYTIPNGDDFEKIQKIEPSKRKTDIIFAGRLLSHKNVDVLIKSIHLVKERKQNIKCLIIGDGPEKKNLELLTKKLNLDKNIKFLGFLETHDNVYAQMKSSKVFVLPSTREGFGIVVVEANACGIPVITVSHKDNAARDLIKEGKNGFICKLKKEEIANRIIRILNNNSDKKMEKGCLDYAKKYDWNKIVGKIEEVYLKWKNK